MISIRVCCERSREIVSSWNTSTFQSRFQMIENENTSQSEPKIIKISKKYMIGQW